MKKYILSVVLITALLMGCTTKKDNDLVYSAPTNEQITDYVYSNGIDVQDSVWIKDSVIVLLENSLITLYADQYGKVYDQKIGWGTNDSEPVFVGDGTPYIATIMNDKLLNSGANRILFTYTDGKSYLRGITDKKGYLIPNTGISEIDNIIIFDQDGKELYKKRG